MNQKPIRNLPPVDGIPPLEAFQQLELALARMAQDAGVSGLTLRQISGSDDLAEVLDGASFAGLTVSTCELEGKSLAHRLLTPGYSLTWVAPAPNDPQDGDDSVEVGEYHRIADVAQEIVRQIVDHRMRVASERRAESSREFMGWEG